MNQEAIIFDRTNAANELAEFGASVKRIGEAMDKLFPLKSQYYTPAQLKELNSLHNQLNSAMMFEPSEVSTRQQKIKDWHNANGNLKTPRDWNAPCID